MTIVVVVVAAIIVESCYIATVNIDQSLFLLIFILFHLMFTSNLLLHFISRPSSFFGLDYSGLFTFRTSFSEIVYSHSNLTFSYFSRTNARTHARTHACMHAHIHIHTHTHTEGERECTFSLL